MCVLSSHFLYLLGTRFGVLLRWRTGRGYADGRSKPCFFFSTLLSRCLPAFLSLQLLSLFPVDFLTSRFVFHSRHSLSSSLLLFLGYRKCRPGFDSPVLTCVSHFFHVKAVTVPLVYRQCSIDDTPHIYRLPTLRHAFDIFNIFSGNKSQWRCLHSKQRHPFRFDLLFDQRQ